MAIRDISSMLEKPDILEMMRRGKKQLEEQSLESSMSTAVSSTSTNDVYSSSMMNRNFASASTGDSKYIEATKNGFAASKQMQAQTDQ